MSAGEEGAGNGAAPPVVRKDRQGVPKKIGANESKVLIEPRSKKAGTEPGSRDSGDRIE